MNNNCKIEWTESTWNPVTGCTKISPGCVHCYAERMAYRLQAMGQPNYRLGFQVVCHEQMLEQPLKWRMPKIIFVNSMSDLFHARVPEFFFKQWGGVNKKKSGRLLERKTWDAMPAIVWFHGYENKYSCSGVGQHRRNLEIWDHNSFWVAGTIAN